MIDTETLTRLLQPAACVISLYLPIETEHRDQRTPDLRLRGLIERVEAQLEQRGLELRSRNALLQPLRDFAAATDFTRHRDPGLALFVKQSEEGEPEGIEIVSLPARPDEFALVGPDAHIKPLLPLIAANRRFNMLMLSKGRVRLVAASPFAWTDIPLETLPIEAQAELDSHLAAEAAPGSHALEQARMALIVAEPRRIGIAVRAALDEDEAPLVLIADPHVAGEFVQQVQIRQLHPVPIHLNPFGVNDRELHERVLDLLQPVLSAETDAVLEQVNARLGTAEPTVAIRLEEILQAARDGRVEAVVVATNEALWGRLVEDGAVHTHGRPAPNEEDLLNQAAVLTLRTGGRAFALPRERLPRGVPAVATLRF